MIDVEITADALDAAVRGLKQYFSFRHNDIATAVLEVSARKIVAAELRELVADGRTGPEARARRAEELDPTPSAADNDR